MNYRYRFFAALAAFLLIPLALQAQSWQWVRSAGGSGGDAVGTIAIDSAGNTYVVGTFEGNIALNTTIFTNGLNTGLYVAKYNPAGVLQWASAGLGQGNFSSPTLAVTPRGDVFLTGSFNGTVRFGTDTLRSTGGYDIFLARYNTSGVLQWTRKQGEGTASIYARGIALDSIDGMYVTGFYSDTARFDTVTITSRGSNDIFVARFDRVGTFRWARSAGGLSSDESYAVGVDGVGNAYITGQFSDTAYFGIDTIASEGGNDIFVAKYTTGGIPSWASRMGGGFTDYAWNIAVDRFGNSYIAGHFVDSARFGDDTVVSAGGGDMFLAKIDGVGEPRWAVRGGGQEHDAAYGITIDGLGNVYGTGRYHDSATFGDTTVTDDTSNTGQVFVVRYNSLGDFEWIRTAGGPQGDEGRGIVVDRQGEYRVAGIFSGRATFGPISLNSTGGFDVFIAKLGADPSITVNNLLEVDFCPGDQFQIPFTTKGVFEQNNIFIAQLSDSAGSFANPIEIGRVFGIGGLTIIGTIPDTVPAGIDYRVRVVSTTPSVVSGPNNADITIHSLPVATITPLGPTTFCRGGSVVLDAGPGFGSYLWNNGEVSRTITVTRTGTYAVTVANARGCAATSDPVVVTVHTPVRPIVTRNGMTLQSTPAASYQWILNGAPVSGATSQTFSPTQEGVYAVRTTDSNGCEAQSDAVQFNFASVPMAGDAKLLSVYPHPNRGLFTVELSVERPSRVRMSIVNALGQEVVRHEEHAEAAYRRVVEIAGLPAGMYIVRLEANGRQWVREVIKQ